MSKMSQLHAELSEQAYELGFESIGEAEQAGYGVDWENGKLVKVEDEQELAHKAWLEERDKVLNGLEICLETSECSPACDIDIERAIKFIKEQCHD